MMQVLVLKSTTLIRKSDLARRDCICRAKSDVIDSEGRDRPEPLVALTLVPQ